MNSEGDLVERRSDARKKNVSDILRKLRTEPRMEVKFYITNTRRLPPVSINHIDVAALLRNVLETRTELLKCQGTLQRHEEFFNEKPNNHQEQIVSLKNSSTNDISYANFAGRSEGST